MRVVESINRALHDLMEADLRLVVMGEDVLDPYGGAFKVTKGLSTAYQDRVWTTPISEGGIVGMATGMALKGRPVIVELMFGDFIALAADQIINHAAKFRWMYNDQVEVPIIIRAPMGGRRGYGPTHSQSLEKHFCGVPGLTVSATHEYADPGALLHRALASRSPHLIIENKVMYSRPVFGAAALPRPPDADIVILTYGGCVEHAVAAAKKLVEEEEIATTVVAVEQLSPFPCEDVRSQVGRCSRVVAVEEGSPGWGFASECARALIGRVRHFSALAGPDHPIPSSREWEDDLLPGVDAIQAACIDLFKKG
ncbi:MULTISPECIES: transketolase C-terminal domain-containing protein [unclassified Mesorhizobium]|uniref:alpha-ketoacid dehydrogenase subunit beta n=1 Tax=unclassified Mesorhizobium TaxID=325217 RepID=UPI000FCC52C8|nr:MULTISPECIES: transketolase C-terminal domain-containing protein [unclassified Mesorhizobium]RUX95362.1 alpha-ketoacid dehydrogenase subunit beta [Mesorhizobium sp. M7D.F.Ca.US.004.01.2.1]RVA36245.1 alpha-ketoacid dehydrogenase subunit beta [Mesorhizobium sp. M7D.F.Ca.US.004.03.1.1]